MQFMIIRKADAQTEAGVMPTEEQLSSMMQYNQEMLDAGVLLTGEGLHPTSNAARIKFTDGAPTVTDGPFAETKELIAGFTMIRVSSREEALEWIRKWPEADVELELRQVFATEEFGEAFTPELQEQEARMREQTAQHG
ncbi:MAG: YciI family protein [Vicinamibacterales bacterium]|nr:YciI family protein [Vicinamibacterales bacterium]